MKITIEQLDESIAKAKEKLAQLEVKVETTKTGERCRQYEIEAYKSIISSYQKRRQELASGLFK